MRIGIITYPMLFQREGFLRDQVRAIVDAFSRLRKSPLYGEVALALADPQRELLDEYDVIHVIGGLNGNHAVLEAATARGVPVVFTPLIDGCWERADGARVRLADQLLARLTRDKVQSTYFHIRAALALASVVVAQSRAERLALASAFLAQPAKLRVVPQGVDRLYYEADEALFRQRTGIKGEFALMAAPISGRYNQLAVARVMDEMALPLVLVGTTGHGDAGYMTQLRATSGVTIVGELFEQPRLRASAFAAASMLIMPPCRQACQQASLGALQALAAGTQIIADPASMSLHALPDCATGISLVRWSEHRNRKAVIIKALDHPPLRERVREAVRDHGWDRVAAQLLHCYADAINAPESGTKAPPAAHDARLAVVRSFR